jgi:hypothetical protein
MSDPTPRDIFEAVGITSGQLYQNLLDLYSILKTPDAARADSDWAIEAMEICRTAAEEVYRHLHPEVTQKEIRKAQAQDEARKVYLATEEVLKRYRIPTKQGALQVLKESYGISYKSIRWLEKSLKALVFFEYLEWNDGVDSRPPWISQLHLDGFARKWEERQKKVSRKKREKPLKKQGKPSPLARQFRDRSWRFYRQPSPETPKPSPFGS